MTGRHDMGSGFGDARVCSEAGGRADAGTGRRDGWHVNGWILEYIVSMEAEWID